MSNLLEAREKAFELVTTPHKNENISFNQYSSIYMASTSNVIDTMSLYNDYKKVLAVGSTGAHGYEALLNGATKVDLFDINELQRLYFEYMKTAIIHLKYEDFIKHFTLKYQKNIFQKSEISDFLSNELYSKLSPFVPKDVEFVFGPLFEMFYSPDLILSRLFKFNHNLTLNYLKKYISFYNEDEYYRLQNILRKGKSTIQYYQANLCDIPIKFADKYDLIILDNILQYYKNISEISTPYNVNMFIYKKLSTLLSENGCIQACYGFEIAADGLKKSFNIPYKNKINSTIFAQLLLEKELKEGICYQLAKKWNHYSYNFIEGVEKNHNENAQNVVLTYKPRI